MNQVLDYSKVCAACSTLMTEPPRDGPDSMCAHMHTVQGRAEFKAILDKNRVFKDIVDSAQELTALPEVVTVSGDIEPESGDAIPSGDAEVVTSDEEVVTPEPWAVTLGADPDLLPGETRQQRYRRLNRDRVNARERDRRNHT